MATPTRLNVSFAPHDGRLEETLTRISDLTLVDSHEARDLAEAAHLRATRVGDAVERTVANSLALDGLANGFTLDLIGHANSSGVLQLGEWQIDQLETQSQELARRFQALKIKPAAIRLLGCNTGLFAGGQQAMLHLREVFGDVTIFGAIAQLHSRNFEAGGLSPDGDKLLLCTTDTLPRAENPATVATSRRQFEMLPRAPQIEDVFERLGAESLEHATHDVRITLPRTRWPVRQLGPQEWNSFLGPLIQDQLATAPGLLAAPEAEALLAVDTPTGERFHRATLLLAGWLVRVYPADVPEGVILRSQRQLTLDGGAPVQLPPVGVAAGPADGT